MSAFVSLDFYRWKSQIPIELQTKMVFECRNFRQELQRSSSVSSQFFLILFYLPKMSDVVIVVVVVVVVVLKLQDLKWNPFVKPTITNSQHLPECMCGRLCSSLTCFFVINVPPWNHSCTFSALSTSFPSTENRNGHYVLPQYSISC